MSNLLIGYNSFDIDEIVKKPPELIDDVHGYKEEIIVALAQTLDLGTQFQHAAGYALALNTPEFIEAVKDDTDRRVFYRSMYYMAVDLSILKGTALLDTKSGFNLFHLYQKIKDNTHDDLVLSAINEYRRIADDIIDAFKHLKDYRNRRIAHLDSYKNINEENSRHYTDFVIILRRYLNILRHLDDIIIDDSHNTRDALFPDMIPLTDFVNSITGNEYEIAEPKPTWDNATKILADIEKLQSRLIGYKNKPKTKRLLEELEVGNK